MTVRHYVSQQRAIEHIMISPPVVVEWMPKEDKERQAYSKFPISNVPLFNYFQFRSSWLGYGACVFNNLHWFFFQEHVPSGLELKLTFTKNRSKKRQTSCLPQPPRSTEMYPKIEKVLKGHAITAGLVKDKQSDRAEIISEYIPLKMVLGQVTGKTRKHPPSSMKADAGRPRLC